VLLAPAGWPAFERALLGGLALAGFYLALVLISPSGMGLGDVKAAGSLGSLLAWAGWRTLFLGGFAGFALAAVCSLVLLAFGRITRKQQIPFGPFMIVGAFAVLLAFLAPTGRQAAQATRRRGRPPGPRDPAGARRGVIRRTPAPWRRGRRRRRRRRRVGR
jgi:Type IV leader peptidase family